MNLKMVEMSWELRCLALITAIDVLEDFRDTEMIMEFNMHILWSEDFVGDILRHCQCCLW